MSEKTQHRFVFDTPTHLPASTLTVEEQQIIFDNWNKVNRPFNNAHAERISVDIVEGRWNPMAPNTVWFDKFGNLIDGQHRLAAHLLAKSVFVVDVYAGLPSEAILFVDKNLHRNAGVNPTLYESLFSGTPPTKEDFKIKKLQLSVARLWLQCSGNKRPSDCQLESFYIQNRQFIDAAMVFGENPAAKRPGYLSALARFFQKDPQKATEFRDAVGGDGALLPVGSPVLLMRTYLSKASIGGSQTRIDHYVTVSAIHAFRDGKTMRNVTQKKEWDF